MATKTIAWQTGSGNITLTYQGQGDGTISVVSDINNGGARSQTITVQTLDGVVTRNISVSQAACPIPVGTVLNYAYIGNYQQVSLPAGKYKLQCWGAQGGSNAAASSYGITSQSGGKGGYSEGIITLTQATTFKVYVGGQGSSSSGGYNGGGPTVGSNSISETDFYSTNRMAGGGGATDIRLSDGSLYSRMIVAGGGGGGAMGYRWAVTWSSVFSAPTTSERYIRYNHYIVYTGFEATAGVSYKFDFSGSYTPAYLCRWSRVTGDQYFYPWNPSEVYNITENSWMFVAWDDGYHSGTFTAYTSSESSNTYAGPGFYGGGTTGGGDNCGTQSQAGYEGSFGSGAYQEHVSYRYLSGAGGGGWYGGGCAYIDTNMSYISGNGGGSGWVNTYANRGYRPSGYTGLQLDSGTTTAGNQSFPATGGGNETGHAGNGYARITRIS